MQYLYGKYNPKSYISITDSFRLQEETAKVEKSLLEGNFTTAIIQCFNTAKANAFDYNLLEPLSKLLRLSSPVAISLARPELFSGIQQKLNHKKAVVRVNLLRIVRSICDPSDERVDRIRGHSLFDAIQRLAENDTSVLVKDIASELVKANSEKDSESGSGGRSRTGQLRRNFTPPSLSQSSSSPITPTHISGHLSRVSQSSAFIEGSVTPRRLAAAPNGDGILYRPGSRDGPQMQRRTSAEITTSSSMSKSRLPRTSMLRATRSSLAPGTTSEDLAAMTGNRKENGVRLRDQSRSAGVSSPSVNGAGGTAPLLSSKRRARAPSSDLKWG